MRIISIRKGFTSDHSSTSYEFLAVDKALGKKERAEVASLSRRANPTSRRVSFVYHADGYDIPGGWERLMEKYYDLMYCEDYDWWTFSLAFNTTQEQIEDLYKYEFAGYDELGVYIDNKDSRVIVTIHCRVDMSSIIDPYDYEDYYDDEDDEENEEEEDIEFATDDELLNLLVQVRHQLIKGDYRTLYAVWEQYGFDKEDEDNQDCEIPVPPEKNSGNDIVEQFKNILAEE